MSVFKGIKRYSVGFVFLFVLLSVGCVLAFLLSSEREVTFESCKKLGLPILELSTNKNKEITSKEDYVKGDFTLTESSVVLTGKCKVRGHGNSTWKTTFTKKKPYLLKLDREENLLGMPAARKWILMANSCDRSMLRNFYAEHLTHNVWNKMRWNPQSKFITLFINGKYRGL